MKTTELPELPEPWHWEKDEDGRWAARRGSIATKNLVTVHEGAWPPDGNIAISLRPRDRLPSAPASIFGAVAKANKMLDKEIEDCCVCGHGGPGTDGDATGWLRFLDCHALVCPRCTDRIQTAAAKPNG